MTSMARILVAVFVIVALKEGIGSRVAHAAENAGPRGEKKS